MSVRSIPYQKPNGNVITLIGSAKNLGDNQVQTQTLHSLPCVAGVPDPSCTSPRLTQPIEEPDYAKLVPDILKECENLNSYEFMHKLQCAARAMQTAMQHDYWLTDEGQEILGEKTEERSKPGLNILDYASAAQESLCPMTALEDE